MPQTEYFREIPYGRTASTQVAVSTAATLIADAAPARYMAHIALMAAQPVYLGNSAVTPANGAYVIGVLGAGFDFFGDDALYGVSTAGTVAVSVLERFSS